MEKKEKLEKEKVYKKKKRKIEMDKKKRKRMKYEELHLRYTDSMNEEVSGKKAE